MKKRAALQFLLLVGIGVPALQNASDVENHEILDSEESCKEYQCETNLDNDDLLDFFDTCDDREVVRISKPVPSRFKVIMIGIAIRAALWGGDCYSCVKSTWIWIKQWMGYGK